MPSYKPKHVSEEPTTDEQLEDLYDQAMADIYDILMEAYDKAGVRIKELVEQVDDIEEYEVELDDEDYDDSGPNFGID